MTQTPGIEPSPFSQSEAAKDGPLPQGLKSSPRIANPDYPNLGFNPVPGSTDTVSGLYKKLAGCAKVLEDTRDLVTKLMDGSYWKGDAAVAFREQLDEGPLPLNLKNAARSLRKAAKQLNLWEGELDDFQRRAKRLDEEAKDARAVVDTAKGKATTAGDDPALDKKKGAGHDDAQKALTSANTAVDEAEADLEKILGRARKLAEEHESQAQYRAGKIRDATKKLAPHEPGWFDSAVDWLQREPARHPQLCGGGRRAGGDHLRRPAGCGDGGGAHAHGRGAEHSGVGGAHPPGSRDVGVVEGWLRQG